MAEEVLKNIKRLEEKLKENLEVVHRRLNAIENAITDIYSKLSESTEEKRFKELEERISDVEDLQMLTRIELIKINEFLKKTPISGISNTLEPRIDHLEKVIKNIEESISTKGIKTNEKESVEIHELNERIERIEREIEKMKNEIENKLIRIVKIIEKSVM